MAKCKHCGKEFIIGDYAYQKDGYCSANCGTSRQAQGLREARMDVLKRYHHEWGWRYCYDCGNKYFVGNDYEIRSGWCRNCEEIRRQEHAQLQEKHKFDHSSFQCDWCGKTYFRKDSTAEKREVYCSKRCEVHR